MTRHVQHSQTIKSQDALTKRNDALRENELKKVSGGIAKTIDWGDGAKL